jgi:hypothetical protein
MRSCLSCLRQGSSRERAHASRGNAISQIQLLKLPFLMEADGGTIQLEALPGEHTRGLYGAVKRRETGMVDLGFGMHRDEFL